RIFDAPYKGADGAAVVQDEVVEADGFRAGFWCAHAGSLGSANRADATQRERWVFPRGEGGKAASAEKESYKGPSEEEALVKGRPTGSWGPRMKLGSENQGLRRAPCLTAAPVAGLIRALPRRPGSSVGRAAD